MKLRNSYDPKSYSVSEAVMYRTDSSFDNYGAVECLREQLTETRKMFAAVMQLLTDKEIISGPEVAALVHMTLVLDE